jgi:hypothetical protein
MHKQFRVFRSGVDVNSDTRGCFVTLTGEIATGEIRAAKMQERDYVVVPVVALVEGVLFGQNSESPELALAAVFGAQLEGWNGRPVVMDHPQLENGTFVSANAPEIQDLWGFGHMFNARLEDKKLKVDAWLDVARAEEMGGDFEETLGRLEDGEMVEVSVGVFVLLDETPGVYNGKEYGATWMTIVPDHLALLPNGVLGACSNATGCGAPRVNSEGSDMSARISPRAAQLTQPVRPQQNIRRPNVNNSNSDLYRRFAVAPTPVSPAAQSACNCGGETDDCSCHPVATIAVPPPPPSTSPMAARPVRPQGSQVFVMDAAELAKRISANFSVNALPRDRFDSDIYRAISKAVRKTYRDAYCFGYTQDYVVFEQYIDGQGYTFYKVPITVNEDMTVEFTGEAVPVTLVTSIIEDGNSQEDSNMTTASGASANAHEPTGAEAVVAANAPATEEPTTTAETPAPTSPPAPLAAAAAVQDVSVEDYIASAPPAIREVLRSQMAANSERKDRLVKGLLSTNRCSFTESELRGMETTTLERISALAQVESAPLAADYSGRGAPQVLSRDENQPPQAPLVFERGRRQA